jgi:hypothetical protein
MKYNFFSEYFIDFAWCPTLVRPNLTVYSVARMHLRHIQGVRKRLYPF